MTTLLTLAAMFSAIATTTPRVSYSSKLDIWMVFCVIFVFGTLMEFSLLIFLQKQVFGPKVILPSWKNLLCRPKATSTNTLGGSVYRKRRHSIPTEDMGGPTSNNANGGSQVWVSNATHSALINFKKVQFRRKKIVGMLTVSSKAKGEKIPKAR